MRLHAFRGVHYRNPEDAARRAAPPFDQIHDGLRERLHASDPEHFAHLTRPAPSDEGTPAERTARLYGEWADRGTIQRDAEPALYAYSIELAGGGRRLGICGLVGLEPPGSPAIRPHEHTVAKTVSERLDLLRTLEVDLEPILLLSDDGGKLDPLIASALEGDAREIASHTDPDGHLHRVFRLSDPDLAASLKEALAGRDGVIADGHHRYRVAQLYAEQSGARPGSATATKLAVVTSLADPALSIEPIHRRLSTVPAPGELGAIVASRSVLKAGSGAELAGAVADAPQPALAVWNGRDAAELWSLDPQVAPARFGPAANDLAVVLLHTGILPELGFGEEAWTDGTVEYQPDPEQLYSTIAEQGGCGIWTPPMPPDRFAAAVAHGDLLPPKSTRFMPKLVSGLVWSDHATELG